MHYMISLKPAKQKNNKTTTIFCQHYDQVDTVENVDFEKSPFPIPHAFVLRLLTAQELSLRFQRVHTYTCS